MKHVVIIDNYDSFTYNLVQAVGQLQEFPRITVLRNDAVTAGDLEIPGRLPSHLIISPGPCTPDEAGNSCDIIAYWAGRIPILGVCLGHQCIAQAFGGQVVRAQKCMHGKTSTIRHDGKGIFASVPNPFIAMRYHSLIVDITHLDRGFVVSATTDSGEIMAIRNEALALDGVQFHPESFATEQGTAILRNFLA
jgi:anthranilate synthase/aminodeoxychorismate synthase-like glutamine amidotransferase